ncbi:hypothetical protein E4U55_003820 [Claviceps digitariae]|nr:hypothetical protein E4U55_003820 [Claviceps digitariae]
MITTSKGIKLEEHEGEYEDQQESYLDWFLSSLQGLVTFAGGCFNSCCSARQSGSAYCHDEDEDKDKDEEDGQHRLLDGRSKRFLPTQAAASFLRTGTPRRMHEANSIL